jgi:hypothetical protein
MFAIFMREESHAFDPQRNRTQKLTVSFQLRESQRHPDGNREYSKVGHLLYPAVAANKEIPLFRVSPSTERFYRSRRPPLSLYTCSC